MVISVFPWRHISWPKSYRIPLNNKEIIRLFSDPNSDNGIPDAVMKMIKYGNYAYISPSGALLLTNIDQDRGMEIAYIILCGA